MLTITDKVLEMLEKREFVTIATVSPEGQPNSVPRFFLRAKGNHIYLIDHVMGQTVWNIRENPRVSVSFMNHDTLEGYRINGTAKVISKGRIYDAMMKRWNERVIELSADRVIEAVRTGRKRGHYEVEISDKLTILKVRVESVIKIGRKGDIWNENV